MEINDTLRNQIEAILKAKGVKQKPIEQLIKQQLSPELAEMVIKSGRLAPCLYLYIVFSPSQALMGLCKKGHKLDCLNCPGYEPTETPGELGDGIAQFEYGRVIHLVKSIESDSYYRSGTTLCGREIDEQSMAVEIYPDKDISDIPKKAICKKCAANAHAKLS
jgi:hypothetical protein